MAPLTRTQRFGAEIVTDGYNHRIVEALGKDVIKMFQDFTAPSIASNALGGWTTTLVGSSTLASTTGSGGLALFTTTTSSGDGVNTQSNAAAFRVDNNPLYFGTRFKVSDATNTAFFIGLSVTDTAILTNLGKRIGFNKASGGTGVNFEYKKTNTSTLSAATLADDTYVELEFIYDRTAGKIYFYVNGNESVVVDVTNLPDADLKPSIHFKTGAAAAKTMTLDWINVAQFGRS